MAPNERDDNDTNADALRAMADGRHEEVGESASSRDSRAPDLPYGGIDEAAAEASGEWEAIEDPAGEGDRTSRAAKFQARAQQANAHQFKKMMIPLLLVVGLLLLAVGAGTVALAMSAGDDPGADASPLLRNATLFVTVCWLLGAILLAGAWLFRRDVRLRA